MKLFKRLIPLSVNKDFRRKARRYLSHFRRGNVVMFHIGRCGSTVLTHSLNLHPRVFWDDEIYYRYAPRSTLDQLPLVPGLACRVGEKILHTQMPLAGQRYYGFDLQTHLLNPFEIVLPDFIRLLKKLSFTHFIILKRKNYLRKVISSLVMILNGRLHIPYSARAEITQIEIDVNSVKIKNDDKPLFDWFRQWDKEYNLLKKSFNEYENVLHLCYEDDLMNNPIRGYLKTCDFIGLQADKRISVPYSRTNPFPINSMVKNFKDVQTAFHGTQYEWMVDD